MWLFLVFVLRDIISNFNVYKKNGKDYSLRYKCYEKLKQASLYNFSFYLRSFPLE